MVTFNELVGAAQMAGFTFNRQRIGEILSEISRQKKAAKDYVGDTRMVRAVAAEGALSLGFQGADPDAALDLHGFNRNGANQFAESMGIPRDFFNRMRSDGRHVQELAHLSNHFHFTEHQTRMFRVLDGNVRAVLSTGYRRLDNADLFYLAADEFQKAGAEIWEARLSDDSFRLYAVQPGIAAEVRDEVKDGTHWNPTDGGTQEQRDGKVDRHVAAVCIKNSETGNGACSIRPCTLRMVCCNWNVWDKTLSVIHVGKKQAEEGWISQDTHKLEDRVIWSKIRDVIKTAFDQKRFAEVIAKLQGAKNETTPDPIKAVEAAVDFCGLPESSIDAIRNKFIMDKDFSRYGLVQALTYQAHAAQDDESRDLYDDAGAKVLASSMKAVLA